MAGDDADDLSPSGPSSREDHGWLRAGEQELAAGDTQDPDRTTKVGKARLVKVPRAPGARRRAR